MLYHEKKKKTITEGHPMKGTDNKYVRSITLSWTITLHYGKRILLNQASQFSEKVSLKDKTYCLLLLFR